MAQRLFVGNLSWDTTEDALREFFSQAGTVTSVDVITDKYTGKPKGFAFVEMGSDAEAKTAIDQLNGQMLDNRALTVNEARPMAPRQDRGGQGGGGGRSYGRDNRGGGSRDRQNAGMRGDSTAPVSDQMDASIPDTY